MFECEHFLPTFADRLFKTNLVLLGGEVFFQDVGSECFRFLDLQLVQELLRGGVSTILSFPEHFLDLIKVLGLLVQRWTIRQRLRGVRQASNICHLMRVTRYRRLLNLRQAIIPASAFLIKIQLL